MLVVCGSLAAAACAAGDETKDAFGDPYITTAGEDTTGLGSDGPMGGSTFGVESESGETEGVSATDGTTSASDPTMPTTQTSLTTLTTQGGTNMTTVDPTDDCPEPCGAPANDCYVEEGWCENGVCVYGPKFEGEECDDGDPCTSGDSCDGMGVCVSGEAMDCSPPAHAQGGECVDGGCEGFTCVAPYENCDGDWDNGCEVPTGVANQCNQNGLTEDGCWTAYCGSSNDSKATNFGSFYCYDCSTCHVVGNNLVQWCEHATGDWYPPDAGGCGAYEDLVCAP